MNKVWQHKERTGQNRIEAEFRSVKLPFKKRIDIVWLLFVLVLFTVFIAWWLIGVVVGHRLGIFDPPPLRPVSDPRILANIRDSIGTQPLLDAVYHQPEGTIYLSQTGGMVHRYNPSTGLWNSEKPFSTEQLLNPEITLFRSGNGTAPLSYHKPAGENWSQSVLWGKTGGGGLVRYNAGQWEIVKSDTLFTGANGQPVDKEQLTAAAISQDNHWLLLGTKNNGIGIYNQETRRWQLLPKEFYSNNPFMEVTHLTWCHDRFWIGGPTGLASLQPEIQPLKLQYTQAIDGAILDMDVDFKGRLWVLDKHSCSSGGQDCLRLARFDFQNPQQQPQILFNENHVFTQLTLEDLSFAGYWQDWLILAGSAGVYSYNTVLHSWERHFNGDVSTTLPDSEGDGFYFGYTGGIGVVSTRNDRPREKPDKRCTTWPLPYPHINERVTKLHFGKTNEILALSQSGKLFKIDLNDGKVYVVLAGEQTGMNPREFKSVLAFGDIVIFSGEQNALIHNFITRSYKDVPVSMLPEWLRGPDVWAMATNGQVYTAVKKKWKTDMYRISIEDATNADFKKAVHLDTIDGQINRVCNWNNQGIALIAGEPDGRVFRYTQQKETLTGMAVMDMNRTPLLDVAPTDDGIIAATTDGIRNYNYHTRSWGPYKRLQRNAAPREVVRSGGKTWVSTQGGQLVELTPLNKFEGRIGGETGFDMTDTQLSDVKLVNGLLYLGGNGWVNCYDPVLRRITERWELPDKGDVKIVGIIQGQPLVLSQGRALVGSTILDNASGKVLNLLTDSNYIWTLRQSKTQGTTFNYLKRYPKDEPFSLNWQCYFHQPYTGGGAEYIRDALEINDGIIAVSTEKGLFFYNTAVRSWCESQSGQFSTRTGNTGGRLYSIAGNLVQVFDDSTQAEFTYTDLATIQLPASCSNKPVILNEKYRKARALALHPQDGRIALINPSGEVVEWLGGTEIEKLVLPGNEPEPGSLKRVFATVPATPNGEPDWLLFTTSNGIMAYDLQKRSWNPVPLNIPVDNDRVKELNVNTLERQAIITAKTTKGKIVIGTIDLSIVGTLHNPVEMRTLYTPGSGINETGDRLLDVQMRNKHTWTFVFNDRIKYFDPVTREWSPDVIVPGNRNNTSEHAFKYCQVKDRGVIAMPGDRGRGGQVWWVARQGGNHPVSFARYMNQPAPGETIALDNNATVWRLQPGGKLYRDNQPLEGNYIVTTQPVETPFVLETATVKGAFEWPGRILFDTSTGIRLLDKSKREEIPLPDDISGLTGIEEITGDGETLWLRTRSDQKIPLEKIPENVNVPKEIKNQWNQLKKYMLLQPDGTEAYDPITKLDIDNTGRLTAQRPSGETFLAQAATFNPGEQNVPEPLETGWLRWNRENRRFIINTAGKEIGYSPNELIREGKLIFEEIDALVVTAENSVSVANQYGIWKFSNQTMDLNDPNVTVQPLQWHLPISAAHNYFITDDGEFDQTGTRHPLGQANHQVRFGDVTLNENIRGTGVTGQIKRGQTLIDAFTQRGFTWDHGKQGLAYTTEGLLIQTEAGLHPVEGYSGFEALPILGKLYSPEPDTIYLRQGTAWYMREGPNQWKRGVTDPRANRTLIDNPTWKWELRDGEPQIHLKGVNYGFRLETTAAGIAFSSDIVQGVAAIQDDMMVMTDAFFEMARPAGQLSYFQADRSQPMPVQRLETILNKDKQPLLLLKSNNQYFRWDSNAQKFTSVANATTVYNDLFLAEVPITNPWLRFSRETSGNVKKELKVWQQSGTEAWNPFDLSDRHFPFDRVTSIAARGNELVVGTQASLQVYSGQTGTGMENIVEQYGLRGERNEPLAPIIKVGIPLEKPERLEAYSTGECFEKPAQGAAVIRKCTGTTMLEQRLRLRTPLWQFIETRNRLIGQYRDQKGNYSSPPVTIQQGRFPHDSIKDINILEGNVFTLWENGWISRHKQLSLDMAKEMVNYNTQTLQPQRLILANQNIYVEGGQQRVWQYNKTKDTWEEIYNPEIKSTLVEYTQKQPIVNRKNLRLMPNSFTFEYRGADGRWQPLPWHNGNIAIDHWTEFFTLEGNVWAATPLGLVSYTLSTSSTTGGTESRIEINPDEIQVIPLPGPMGKIPEITDTSIREDNRLVTLRCGSNSEYVYQGTIGTANKSTVFTRLKEDPFVNQQLVTEEETGFWEWRREGKQDFHPGRLRGKIRGETIELVGGRYSFDSISSIAFFQDNRVEIGTESGGWYSVPEQQDVEFDLQLKRYQRPKVAGLNPLLVTEVRDNRSPEGVVTLGLRAGSEGFIRLGSQGITGKTKEFPQYLGNDGFWNYMKEGSQGKLIIRPIRGTGAGQTTRQMREGRFSDDIVLGLPVSSTETKGTYILLPTEAGILRLDETLKPIDIYPATTLQAGNSDAPRVLYINHRSDTHKVLYMGQGGMYPLQSTQTNQPVPTPAIPEGYEILAIEEGPQDFLRYRWKRENQQGWFLVNPDNPKETSLQLNTLYINVKEFYHFKGNAQPWMQVQFKNQGIEFMAHGTQQVYQMENPEPLDLLAAFINGKQLLLIAKTNLWEINLEHAAAESFK